MTFNPVQHNDLSDSGKWVIKILLIYNSIFSFRSKAESNQFLVDVDVEVLLGGVVQDETQPVLLLGLDEADQTLAKADVTQPDSGLLSSLGQPL